MQLLICGIPGTGKSTFSRWLAAQHSYVHVDVDVGVSTPLDELMKSPRLVIDWGFPLASFATVEALIERGLEPWWFDGDRGAALSSFLSRGNVPKVAWDQQLAGIESRWQDIARLFRGRILNVIAPGPIHMQMEERFTQITGSRDPHA